MRRALLVLVCLAALAVAPAAAGARRAGQSTRSQAVVAAGLDGAVRRPSFAPEARSPRASSPSILAALGKHPVAPCRPVAAGQAVGARRRLRQGARPRQRCEAVPLGARRRGPASRRPHRHGGRRPPARPAAQPSAGARRDRAPSRRSGHARRDRVLPCARARAARRRASPRVRAKAAASATRARDWQRRCSRAR